MIKVTKDSLAAIKINGHPRYFRCNSVADFQSQQRMAYWIKQNCPREDGGKYIIKSSAVDMVISVSVE